jgi:hypothetical protein
MSQTAHEQFVAYRKKDPPSDRTFGLTVGAALIFFAAIRGLLGHVGTATILMACIGVALIMVALVVPALLRRLNRAWMGLGEALGLATNMIIMLILFALIFTPLAVSMRLFRRDALRLKPEPAGRTYWHERGDGSESGGLFNQF